MSSDVADSNQVVAVVVSWHGGELLQRCLVSILADSDPRLQVLVHDNSNLAAPDYVAALPRVHWTRSAANLGFGCGVNAAVGAWQRLIGEDPSRSYVLINQDCLMRPGWLQPLLSELAKPEVGVVGARLLDGDGRVEHEGAVVLTNGLTRHIVDSDAASDCIDYVTGAVFAFRESTWSVLGGFDQGYWPVYFEEVDLCLRARARGLRVSCAVESEAVHFGASSSGGSDSALYLRRYHRSRMRLVAQHLLRSHGVLAWLGAEFAWLRTLGSWRQIEPVLRAYPTLLRLIVSPTRRSARGLLRSVATPTRPTAQGSG